MEPIQPNTPSKQKSLFANILLVILKIIAYLVVVGCAMYGGLGLISTLLPDTSMGTLVASDFYDWENLNFQYLGLTIGILLGTLTFRYFVDDQGYQSLGLGFANFGTDMIRGIIWAVGILSVAFLGVWAMGSVSILDTQELGISLLGYLSFFLLVAIVEEVVFRGYLLQMVTDHLNYIVGIAISAIGFAIVHLGNDHFTWIAFCNLTLGGVLMSLLYLKYHRLYVPIGFHWLWNYFQGNVLGFGVSGNDVLGVLQIEVGEPEWLSGGYFGLEGSLVTCVLLLLSSLYLFTQLRESEQSIHQEVVNS